MMNKKIMSLGVFVAALLLIISIVQNRFNFASSPLKPGEAITSENDASQPIREAGSQETRFQAVDFQVEVVAKGLEVPWSLVFTNPDRLLVAERAGRIRVIENNQLNPQPLITLEEVSSNAEEGLMGIAKDPDYENNHFIYACYAYNASGSLQDRVVRLIDEGSSIREDKVILEGIPAAAFHAGCALSFGPDNKLYITTGDATDKNIAQDPTSLGGKILRLNPDGSVPADNPNPESAIFSSGHRNPQGIAWHPQTKDMYATEHGPSGFDGAGGGDEINLIEPGKNYGWPLVSHDKNEEGLVAPLKTFTPAEAPASAMFYGSVVFPQFTNSLFFGALRGEGLVVATIDATNPALIIKIEKLNISVGRVRAVVEGPEGFIYFTSSNRDGRGKINPGDDKVYRLVPLTP